MVENIKSPTHKLNRFAEVVKIGVFFRLVVFSIPESHKKSFKNRDIRMNYWNL